MGFICPECRKDFGNNREWFDDHRKAHLYDNNWTQKVIIRKDPQATITSIKKAIESGKIRVWMDYDGYICFETASTKNMFSVNPYYDLEGNRIKE